jgi:methylaspartate ammonia-lyase
MKSDSKILDIKAVKGQGAYYYEDVTTLQKRSVKESDRWRAKAETPGFTYVREVAEVVSIGIKTQEGIWCWGDCVGVSYSGKSGREGAFRSGNGLQEIEKIVRPFLLNKRLTTYREVMNEVKLLSLHPAVHYGISQALLKAVALNHREEMWQTLQREWGIAESVKEVPIQGSSGNNRIVNADKMIINRLAGLPHGQIDDIETQLGFKGEVLLDYVSWLTRRISELGASDYLPVVHLDVHGAIGKIFDNEPKKICEYLQSLEKAAGHYRVRVESVALGRSREETIQLLIAIKHEIQSCGLKIALVADEWANTREDIIEFARQKAVDMVHIKMPDLGGIEETVEAVLALKKQNVETLLGGSCVETDLSARVSVHVALAIQPTAMLAKPGMGIDEAIQIMRNEMNRALLLS